MMKEYVIVVRNKISFHDFDPPGEIVQYDRWQIAFPTSSNVKSVIFTKPDGRRKL